MKEKIKLRFYRMYDGGEMFQVQMPNGSIRYIGRMMWNDMQYLNWLCDAPDGYCENDTEVHTNDYELVWCDNNWNPLGAYLMPWETKADMVKSRVLRMGLMPDTKGERRTNDIVREMFEQDNHNDNYVENAMYCRWQKIGKPEVVTQFVWAGFKCYVMHEREVHSYLPLINESWYVICAERYWSLPHRILAQRCIVSDDCDRYRKTRWTGVYHEYPYSDLRKDDRYGWRISSGTMGYCGMNAPSIGVLRQWCKDNGLHTVVPMESQYGRKLQYRVKDLPYSTENRPEGFVPYPVMSNGAPRMGGYLVKDNVVYVYRPNPNWHPEWDGKYNGVDYAEAGDKYAWQAFHRFQKQFVTF